MKKIIELLAVALSPQPYCPIGDRLILLTAIAVAEINPDGSLTLTLGSGLQETLTPGEVREMEKLLETGISRARQQALAAPASIIDLHGKTH